MQDPSRPVARIEHTDSASGSEFVAVAQSTDAFTGDFRLLVKRKGPNGVSTTRQGGRVVLAPGATQRLTVVRVGLLTPADQWEATLEVLQGDEVVASQTLSQHADH